MSTTYNLKMLRVNLTEGTIKTEDLDEKLAKKFLGGRGLGTKILYDEGVATVDPLSPENKLIFINGPLTGANVPTGGRYMVVTKAPLNNMIASSNSGGVWGARLKYAGYDALIVEGKADAPVYMVIDDDHVEIKDAAALWGKTSEETEEVLKEEYGKNASVLNIGPAGENLSLLACIINEADRAAGRTGVGAVMGSKNLKAVVCSSKRTVVEPYDKEALRETVAKNLKLLKDNGVTGTGLPTYGTAVLVNIINNVGSFPTKNWQESQFATSEEISGEMLKEKFLVKQGFCHRCPIGCGRVINMNGKIVGGPEYEPLWAYGANCGLDDLEAITIANYWANEMGLDAIGAPTTIATAMELYQKGFITDEDCDGVPLKWGSSEAIIEWTKRMGLNSNPLAKLMAQGSYRLCEHYGVPELSMSVKKQDMPAYDARGIQGIGLTYATSNRGGCHVRGYMISPEILGLPQPLDRFATEDKALWTKIFQDLTAVIDSTGMCLFTSFALGAAEYAEMINAATGTNYTPEELLVVGERIYNIERQFNKAAGMKPEDDTLPKRLLEEPIPDGPSKGEVSKLHILLPQYYELRGWENAFPTEATLKRLELL
ncbi:MAG: aldehyde ferredoxin oxidoreductase [Firmicutes bacterium HGW-Firmicutes-19]|jgi:aldehyde:ferredoxin oxidoreductase|nr:MAG: aldehyde ferredoxin oxidoreductase [Firmicutes bacterium HGW-Firmicutes-19]